MMSSGAVQFFSVGFMDSVVYLNLKISFIGMECAAGQIPLMSVLSAGFSAVVLLHRVVKAKMIWNLYLDVKGRWEKDRCGSNGILRLSSDAADDTWYRHRNANLKQQIVMYSRVLIFVLCLYIIGIFFAIFNLWGIFHCSDHLIGMTGCVHLDICLLPTDGSSS